ncbi:hypothetical protein [Acaryochloris sp. IP29b_bin.137]|uniref:hypothetical protein n=1 Tax=Acaryochloris sp. IP29b_bin.137 TaxID=2969217 RepID=UPI002638D46A|nr:hypothetical protein [Acaryochloris sp. IP29b_bin.137]
MNIKAITAASLGLSLCFSSIAWAQSGPDSISPSPDSIPASPAPDGSMAPEVPTEATPSEETITPESTSPETGSPDASIGGVDNDGAKLVSCGPNGAAIVTASVRPGCHLLKVNSAPGVK